LALAFVGLGAGEPFCFAQTPPTAAAEPQLFGENVISTADDESHPALTPDGETL
jgi:hypothetical protein